MTITVAGRAGAGTPVASTEPLIRRPHRPPDSPLPDPAVQASSHDWPAQVYERLLNQRVVIAHGRLDDEAATRLCAQLLTLDAEDGAPIRLELQSLDADLAAALTVIGVLDVLRVRVRAHAGGRTSGPALGVLASAHERRAYPNAVFVLSEPKTSFDGPASVLAACEEQVRVMLDDLLLRIARVTGREPDAVREDFRRERLLTAEQAIGYGLVEGLAEQPVRR
jgi:ATP-dependent Clp protease protease subunit